ncbi:MAG: IPTL-CTERM sorting domain-containing protein [Candidatus Competibacteraceae bacterium]
MLVLTALGMPAVALGFQTSALIPNGNGFYSNWASNDSLTGDYTDVEEGVGCVSGAFNDFWVRISSGGNARQSATLNIGTIPNGTTITNIAITVCANDGVTSNGSFRTFTRIDGSNTDAAADITVPLTVSGTAYTQNISLNVAKAAGTAVEVGVRKGNNFTVSIGTLSAVLSYRATPTLSVTNSPVTYNGSPQAATLQANSDVPAPSTVVPGVFSDVRYDGSTTVPTNAGTYAVTADFAPTSTTDYASLDNAPAGNFVINPANQTITFNPAPTVVVGGTGTVSATGGGSGNPVTFSTVSTDCSVDPNTGVVTGINAGANNCVIAANQAGNANYNAAPQVTQTFSIGQATTTTTITSDTPDPSMVNQQVVVNYTVVVNAPGAGTPTGNVTVTVAGPVNNNSCTATVGAGTCTLPGTDFPQPGAYTLTATYAGDNNFSTSFDTEPHQVLTPTGGLEAPIPTLQEWALGLMGLLLGGLVWCQSRRRGSMAA